LDVSNEIASLFTVISSVFRVGYYMCSICLHQHLDYLRFSVQTTSITVIIGSWA